MSIVTINGVDLATLNVSLTGLPGAFSAPAATWDAVAITQRPGLLVTRSRPELAPRTLALSVLLRGTDRADAEAKLQTLKAELYDGPATIAFDWQVSPARSYVGYVQGVEAEFFAQGISDWLAVSLTFLLADPFAVEDTLQTDTDTPPAPLDVLVGTAPTEAVVTIDGPAVDPVLTFRDHTGATIGTMAFSHTLGASDKLIVDGRDGGQVTLDTGGVLSNGLPLVTTQFYGLPVFRPEDADPSVPAWPTVESSTGAALSVDYRRRYL
jgi:hypothetical protein